MPREGMAVMQEELLTEIVVHLSRSHQQMARILDAKRHVAVRMAHLVQALPDEHPQLNGLRVAGQLVQRNKERYFLFEQSCGSAGSRRRQSDQRRKGDGRF